MKAKIIGEILSKKRKLELSLEKGEMAHAETWRQGILNKRGRALGQRGENTQKIFAKHNEIIWLLALRIEVWNWFSDPGSRFSGLSLHATPSPHFPVHGSVGIVAPGLAGILGSGTESSYVSLELFHTLS